MKRLLTTTAIALGLGFAMPADADFITPERWAYENCGQEEGYDNMILFEGGVNRPSMVAVNVGKNADVYFVSMHSGARITRQYLARYVSEVGAYDGDEIDRSDVPPFVVRLAKQASPEKDVALDVGGIYVPKAICRNGRYVPKPNPRWLSAQPE